VRDAVVEVEINVRLRRDQLGRVEIKEGEKPNFFG
jgi:hypothetical protein